MKHNQPLFLIAGEPSGDHLGARLISGLRALRPDLDFIGVGGAEMAAEGLESLFPIEDLAVMGLAEILPRLPLIWRRLGQTARAIANQQPSAVISIDSPDFNMRLAARLMAGPRTASIPRIHYVAPSVWAWRSGRAATMARLFQRVLTILPFEAPLFEQAGLTAVFVGHPAIDRFFQNKAGKQSEIGKDFRARYAIPVEAPLLCVLPGSRQGEIARHGPIFSQTIAKIGRRLPELQVIAPSIDSRATQMQAVFQGMMPPVHVVCGEEEKWAGFAASTVALAASGTVSLELALARTPTIIAYKVNPVTGFIARRLIQVPYVSLVNLTAGQLVQPEYLQEYCTPSALSGACLDLLSHDDKAARQTSLAFKALESLGLGERQTPSEKAAQAIIDYLDLCPLPV